LMGSFAATNECVSLCQRVHDAIPIGCGAKHQHLLQQQRREMCGPTASLLTPWDLLLAPDPQESLRRARTRQGPSNWWTQHPVLQRARQLLTHTGAYSWAEGSQGPRIGIGSPGRLEYRRVGQGQILLLRLADPMAALDSLLRILGVSSGWFGRVAKGGGDWQWGPVFILGSVETYLYGKRPQTCIVAPLRHRVSDVRTRRRKALIEPCVTAEAPTRR
jgi:hypothetical protein